MIRKNQFFRVFVVLFVISTSITLISYQTSAAEWSVTEKDNTLEISYGSGTNFPQYAVLHLNDSFFRLNYGPDSGWGTSVILLPSFREVGSSGPTQGAPVTATWETDGEDLVFSIVGMISTLSVEIQLRILPPVQDSISADVTVNVEGDVELDPGAIEDNEAFKPVTLSSMHISPDKWDTQAAYVGSQTFSIPEDGWIIYPAISGNRFGLKGGTSAAWKTNAPTIEILLDESRPITGRVTSSSNPNDDNVGFWAASDQVLSSWNYTITASNPVRTLFFSGYEWIVKTSDGEQVGPGPNYFSDSEENVWVDDEGKLHLKITQRDGKWYCAEVISKKNFGYGTYRFYPESRIDQIDQNAVLGLFTWDDDPAYNHREIDIEFSKWSDPANDNAQFVVQPWDTPGNMHQFNVQLNGTHSTHSFDWKPNKIFFQSAHGHYANPPATHIIDSWSYTGSDIPLPGNENARMNLWLFQGVPPSNGQEVEVIISAFEFIPIGTPPPPPPPPPPAIPEPTTLLLMGLGLIGMLLFGRKRLNRKKQTLLEK